MIRPEVRRLAVVWLEPVLALALLGGLVMFVLGDLRVSGAFIGLCILAGLVLVIWAANAIARARLRSGPNGAGLVLVDEGRIGHFGPQGGGFVDIDALLQVRVTGAGGQRVWELRHRDGPPLLIPVNARDADQLVDFLVGLDDISPIRISAAIVSGETQTLWRRVDTGS